MASFQRRVKRVTDPLDDRVKAQLVGARYFSSGSEHSDSSTVVGDDSPCLSELVHCFLQDNHDESDQQAGNDTHTADADVVVSDLDDTAPLEIVVKSIALLNMDSYGNLLVADVSKAMEMLSFFKTDKSAFRREVMVYLREAGYNAAICKTKWNSSEGITAGGYEFIDVVQSVSSTWLNRYFVDLDFASEFEIAMPTSEYSRLLQYCPRVFVGRSEELKKIVRAMSDSAKRSLKSRKLSLPPWRKNRYMQMKWFGPYHRTTSQTPANSSSLTGATVHPVNVVQCRYVGFDDAVSGSVFVRTRCAFSKTHFSRK
ncbi:hypothetical protein F3Y22_tig00111105pilonHSYRG00085 [Hibiscus syriacus]|uniref:Uncharacterized protein n=1 Tax=Hibiscus syriacus TaxID=106335 RepID=A0A6A2YYF1_HIBSY|nr:uncharacterized protein LOC120153861 [Hibiscus syriacus]KAE8684621.1 hypothetical protein F3Y22_tig00111105pilonHSYRG00085 [Hibiscus syriacus]